MNALVSQAAALQRLLHSQKATSGDRSAAMSIIQCAEDLLHSGELELSIDLLETSSALLDSCGVDLALQGLVLKARIKRTSGRLLEALEDVAILRSRFSPAPAACSDLMVQARIVEGACLWRLNRVDESLRNLTQIRSELLARPDSHLHASCSEELASALLFAGDLLGAKAQALECLVASRRCGSQVYEGMALANLHRIARAMCRWPEAREAGLTALSIFEGLSNKPNLGGMLGSLAILEWKSGALATSMAHCGRAIALLTSAAAVNHLRAAHLLAALVSLHRGQVADARARCMQVIGELNEQESTRPALLSREYLGDIHLEQEQPAEALKHYDEVWPRAIALVPKGDIVAELRRRRAECYLMLGRTSEAYEEALAGLKHCRDLGDRYEEAATYRVLALASAAVGRTAEAKTWFDQGFAYYEDIETPFEWGKLWMAYGDWLSGPHAGQFSDPKATLEAYRAARDHFERMGAEGKLAAVDRRLHALVPGLDPGSGVTTESVLPESVREMLRPPRRPRASTETERRAAWARETFGTITRNRAVLDVLEQCSRLAAGRAPILLLGESGTGKELLAGGIHRISRRTGQYMPLNCSAIPHEVFESELFGHMTGAFTGASRDKIGIVEACDGGTMFLDEVGELPFELQARILRFLESGEFRRVGATRNTRADTRLIAATNRDRNSLKSGEGFRADLYYRLAHGVVTLPPLRHRGDDIVLLTETFLAEACSETLKSVTFADSAWAHLGAHPWPGNIRELKAVVHRVVALARAGAVIEADALELDESDVPTSLLGETIVVEKRRIEEALRRSGGVKSEAARLLGLSRTTLLSKMKRYGMME